MGLQPYKTELSWMFQKNVQMSQVEGVDVLWDSDVPEDIEKT